MSTAFELVRDVVGQLVYFLDHRIYGLLQGIESVPVFVPMM